MFLLIAASSDPIWTEFVAWFNRPDRKSSQKSLVQQNFLKLKLISKALSLKVQKLTQKLEHDEANTV